MPRRILLILASLVVAIGCAAPAYAKSYRAERFDVRIDVQPDGDLLVTEHTVFRFDGEFRQIFREIPQRRTDGLADVSLVPLADEGPATAVRADGQVSVRGRDGRVRVEWTFPTTRDGARAYRLTYRVRGAVQHGADGPALWWTPLPREHDYPIDRSRIEIHWPAGLRLKGWPSVSPRRMATPVPDIEDTTLAFNLAGLRTNASFEVLLPFDAAAWTGAVPRWQARQQRQSAYAPRLATAAAVIAVLGIAFFFLLYLQSPRAHVDGTQASPTTRPPDTLPVAVAGALQSGNGTPSLPHAMATLIDLAARGHVRVDESEAGRFGSRTFSFSRGAGRDALAHEHERVLLETVFTGPRGPEPTVTATDAQRRLLKHWGTFKRSIAHFMLQERLLDPDRIAARQRISSVAWTTVAVAIVTLVASFFFLDDLGPAVLLVAAGLGVAALAGFVMGAMLTPLSDAGLRAKARWEAFGTGVKEIARGKRPLAGPGDVERLLVWAVAFGAGAAFFKRAADTQASLPAWFGPLSAASDERRSSFSAFLTSHVATSSGGSAGGGGGAGGGGSSGAS